MPILRTTRSTLGIAIVNDIKQFVYDNAKAMERDTEATIEQGAETLAHAIAYGVSKALSNSNVQNSFRLGICPPGGDVVPGNAVGDRIFNALKAVTTEP